MRIFDYLSLFTLEHCHAFYFFHFEWSRLTQTKGEAITCCAGVWNLNIVYSISIFFIQNCIFLVWWQKLCCRPVEGRRVGPALHQRVKCRVFVPYSRRYWHSTHTTLLFVARLLRRCNEKRKRQGSACGSPSAAFEESKTSLLHIKA